MHWNHESLRKLLMHLANFQKGSPPIRWLRFLKIHYACRDAGKEREQDAVSFAHQHLTNLFRAQCIIRVKSIGDCSYGHKTTMVNQNQERLTLTSCPNVPQIGCFGCPDREPGPQTHRQPQTLNAQIHNPQSARCQQSLHRAL